MKFSINRPVEFTPVTVSITLDTLEELQEFEIRMDLYGNDLIRVRPEPASALLKNSGQNHSQIKGITDLRKMLTKELGYNSLLG